MAFMDIKKIDEARKVGHITRTFEELRSSSKNSQNSRLSHFSVPRENQFSRFTHQKNGV